MRHLATLLEIAQTRLLSRRALGRRVWWGRLPAEQPECAGAADRFVPAVHAEPLVKALGSLLGRGPGDAELVGDDRGRHRLWEVTQNLRLRSGDRRFRILTWAPLWPRRRRRSVQRPRRSPRRAARRMDRDAPLHRLGRPRQSRLATAEANPPEEVTLPA